MLFRSASHTYGNVSRKSRAEGSVLGSRVPRAPFLEAAFRGLLSPLFSVSVAVLTRLAALLWTRSALLLGVGGGGVLRRWGWTPLPPNLWGSRAHEDRISHGTQPPGVRASPGSFQPRCGGVGGGGFFSHVPPAPRASFSMNQRPGDCI